MGNAWQSVLQLLGLMTEGWIGGVNGVDDKTVET